MAASTVAVPVRKKSRWFLKLLAALALVLIVLACTFYLRPILIGNAITQLRLWRHGIHSHYVQLGQYRIHYRVTGEGRPLVLVHGLGGRSLDWLDMIPQFKARGFQVYALDLLGFGLSDKPDVDYSISLQTNILRQFMDSQGIQQPDMAGWSMGGWVGLKFAAENPQRVHRLMLLDSAGMKFDAVNASALLPSNLKELDHMFEVLTPHPRPLPAFIGRDTLRFLNQQQWITRRALLSMGEGKDLMDGKLGSVNMPVLIVWGKQDVLTPLSVGEEIHREIPQSTLFVVDGCGHLAPTECADRVVPEMEKFVQ
ncbi:MAG TPA: alpha/beta hydrolase [Candidatus Angelobacter sp.]|nr:alpha/beta hydrolase [Candidatus Angelobacter sp.]